MKKVLSSTTIKGPSYRLGISRSSSRGGRKCGKIRCFKGQSDLTVSWMSIVCSRALHYIVDLPNITNSEGPRDAAQHPNTVSHAIRACG